MIASAAVAAGIAHANAQLTTAPPTTAPSTTFLPSSLTPEQDLAQYLEHLAASLNQGPQIQRDEAAQRLIEIGSPQTRAIIQNALQGADERAQNACAKAIAEGRAIDPAWLPPLIDLLSRDPTVAAAARALVRYDGDPRAYQPLIVLARSRQQTSRTAIINSLGQVVEKLVAETLVAIVSDPTEDLPIRSAAADALTDLSGQSGLGTDASKWQAWLTARNAGNAAQWRTRVLAEQHPILERLQTSDLDRLRQFKSQIQGQLNNQYGRLTPPEKSKLLLSLLNDSDSDVREVGTQLVGSAMGEGQPISEDIHNRLIELVGDASPDVRQKVITVLKNLGDPNALDAILVQLQIENSGPLKIDLLDALSRPQNAKLKAVPVVERMLQDASPQVAARAATTLQALAPAIKANPGQGKQVFDQLNGLMQQRTGLPGMPGDAPGSAELRAALVGAMAKLSDAAPLAAMDLFQRLLDPNEPAAVRRAAVQGLAPLGEQAGDVIAHELDLTVEPDPGVRRAAALALGQVGSFNYAKQLDTSTRRLSEPDKAAREAAWKAFQALLPLPSTSTHDLASWADVFYREKEPDPEIPDRELVVRKELARRYQAAGDRLSLAVEQQRIGEIYLNFKPPQWGESVPYLRLALNYWESFGNQPQTVVTLVQKLTYSLLRSGQYREAKQFGEQEIKRDPANQEVIGPAIRNVVDDLVRLGDPASIKAASDLIDQALSMKPALDQRYYDSLKQLRDTMPPPG